MVLATALWWLPQHDLSLRNVLGWVLCMLTTYVMMETNSALHLIRIRTRMMSCVWLVLAAGMAFMHPIGKPMISAACLSVSYFLLFRCYQLHRPESFIFHSFFFLGLGSFCAPVMIPMALLFYVYLIGFLRSMTWRGVWAGLIGLVTPYWCWLVWCLLTDSTNVFVSYCQRLFLLHPISWTAISTMPLSWIISWIFVGLLCLVGIMHYLYTNYNDKIRVRMMLYVYVVQCLVLLVALALQPAEFQTLMALLIASGSPLIAHYFSLTGSWFSNAFFVLSVLLSLAMSYINLWMPLLSL